MSTQKQRAIARWGLTLGGRDSLAIHGLCSSDPNVVFVEAPWWEETFRGYVFVEPGESCETLNGFRVSPVPKALLDYMEHDYDDSGILEALDCASDDDLIATCELAQGTNRVHLLQDSRWADMFRELNVERR